MMSKGFLSISTIIMVSVLGCKKPEPHTHQTLCVPIPESVSAMGYQYTYSDPYIHSGCINPNNPNEILYVDIGDIISNQYLIVFNRITKEKKLLHTGKFLTLTQWGTNGYILFNTMEDPITGGYAIYRVKSDGTDKTIVEANNCFSPVIHPSGDRFLYQEGNGTFIVKSISGNVLTTCSLGGMGSNYPVGWLNDSVVVFSRLDQIWTHNVNTCLNTPVIYSPDGATGFGAMGVIPPSTIIWGHMDIGIYKTDIATNTQTLIKSSCDSRLYGQLSFSPQINKFLVNRTRMFTDDRIYLRETSELVFMNTDGTCEEIVDVGP